MSFELAKGHIETIIQDIKLIRKLLDDKLPQSTGRPWVQLPAIDIDEHERQFIIDTLDSMGTLITELSSAMWKLDRYNYESLVEELQDNYKKLYHTAISLKQGVSDNDNVLFGPSYELLKTLENIERIILTNNALSSKSENIKTFSQGEVNAIFKEFEKKEQELRKKLYFKVDPNAEQLTRTLTNPSNDDVLDNSVSKLIHLIGYDSEIYAKKLQGDVDVIAIHVSSKTLLIIETTTGSISKKKVDQIVGRINDYEKYSNILLDPTVKVIPVIITSQTESFADELAKREAMVNRISVLGLDELKDLLKQVKKCKIDSRGFREYLLNKIPIT